MVLAPLLSVCLLMGSEPARAGLQNEKAKAAPASSADPRDDASPWGVASGAEWSGDYPRFNPRLRQAGVRWLRLFPEWQGIQPKAGAWDWRASDAIVANARAHGLHVLATWAYFAPFASADGGTRKGPIKDVRLWRDYVAATVARYRRDVKYWEVWNEFNGSFYESSNKPKEYAELAIAAHDAAKRVDPTAKVGLSVANFDVGFLDAAIKAGAKDHFDYLCVHPYENLGAVREGGEMGYLGLAGNLRRMLAANGQRTDLPLWITEIGSDAPVEADAARDAAQAETLAKAYVLSLAQGFHRVFWFEARGPSYGNGADLGLLRPDWSPRPAYRALATMTALLGAEPRYLGWLDVGKGGYGFAFRGAAENVLVAWSPPGRPAKASFGAAVRTVALTGRSSILPADREAALTTAPTFVRDLPASWVQKARANRSRPFPWGGDYANVPTVACRLGALNDEKGLKQVNPNTTTVANGLTETARRPDFVNPALNGEGRYVYFRADASFVPYGTKDLEIVVVAKRAEPGAEAAFGLQYESAKGYVVAPDRWTIPADDRWHEHVWRVRDANFVGQWGWNFRLDATGSPSEFLIREVRVSKPLSGARRANSTPRS